MAHLLSSRKRKPLAMFRPIGVHYGVYGDSKVSGDGKRIVLSLTSLVDDNKPERFELLLSGHEFKNVVKDGTMYLNRYIDKLPQMSWRDVFSHPQQAAEFEARIV